MTKKQLERKVAAAAGAAREKAASAAKEIDALYDKFIAGRREKLKDVQELRKQLTGRIDREIQNLYAKKDVVTDMWVRRDELSLQKIGVFKQLRRVRPMMLVRYLVSMPFIYMMIIPAVIMHVCLEAYHQICFRLYGIPLVQPREYFSIDRQLLPYLNWFEKFNCLYCSYFNGLVAYTREVAGRTERYWCPIKHARNLRGRHAQYENFVEYDEGEELREKWPDLRAFAEYKEPEHKG